MPTDAMAAADPFRINVTHISRRSRIDGRCIGE
jgi:hypothetical protein